MKIILLKDMDTLGRKFDIVNVKPGYGRNYIIPRKLGVIANADNLATREKIVDKIEAELTARLGEFQEMAEKISAAVLKIGAKAGTSGKIFGSVTNVQLSQAIKDQLGLEVDRRDIVLSEEVKNLGTYAAVANLHKQVEAKINFEVIAE